MCSYATRMLIVLPPSETKAFGGDASLGPLDMDRLSFPSLNAPRQGIAEALVAASADMDEALAMLKVKNTAEVEANRALFVSPTMPAITRYTGVLYDALDAASLHEQCLSRLAIGSALFGVVGAADHIPHYRLSGGTKLGGKTMKAWWGKAITQALEPVHEQGLLLDMRSGAYQSLGPVKGAATVRVETTEGKVVSHFNKHYKGELARALALHEQEVNTLDDVAGVAAAAGFEVRVDGQLLTMVVDR